MRQGCWKLQEQLVGAEARWLRQMVAPAARYGLPWSELTICRHHTHGTRNMTTRHACGFSRDGIILHLPWESLLKDGSPQKRLAR